MNANEQPDSALGENLLKSWYQRSKNRTADEHSWTLMSSRRSRWGKTFWSPGISGRKTGPLMNTHER